MKKLDALDEEQLNKIRDRFVSAAEVTLVAD